jgi:hypothetical protein
MCLLVVCKPNSTPSKQDLHNGACSNPHGYGFAIVADGRIITERSMSAKKSIRRFLQLREQYPNGYAMWHARYATHGVKNEQNCHPFQVGDDTQTYLAHNGVLDTFIETGDKRSDTRVFAEDTLPKLGGVSALNDENIYRMVESWATGSKIAVLTVNPVAEYQLYLINEKLGTWDDDGVWWSNSSYKRTVYDYTPSVRQSDSVIMGYSDDEKEFWEKQEDYINRYSDDGSVIDLCPMCEAMIDLEQSPETCEFCASCLYCFQLPLDCDCYDPKQKAHARGFDFDNEWTASKSYDSLLV